jgi:hypothetical protein
MSLQLLLQALERISFPNTLRTIHLETFLPGDAHTAPDKQIIEELRTRHRLQLISIQAKNFDFTHGHTVTDVFTFDF